MTPSSRFLWAFGTITTIWKLIRVHVVKTLHPSNLVVVYCNIFQIVIYGVFQMVTSLLEITCCPPSHITFGDYLLSTFSHHICLISTMQRLASSTTFLPIVYNNSTGNDGFNNIILVSLLSNRKIYGEKQLFCRISRSASMACVPISPPNYP